MDIPEPILNLFSLQFKISPTKVVFLLALLVVSMFASSSETALFSLDRFQMRRLRDRFRDTYTRIQFLLSKPTRLLILILLLNECVNLLISAIVTESFEITQDNWLITSIASLLISAPTLLFFGEITPKIIAAKSNRLVAMLNSPLLTFLYRLFFPILWILDSIISLLLKIISKGHIMKGPLTKFNQTLSEEDILMMTAEGHREGTVYKEEKELIHNVFEFGELKVTDVMTPIHQAFSVSANQPISEVIAALRMQKYSRIPVYLKSRSNIVGILYVKDLLTLHPDLEKTEVRSLMNRTLHVSPEMHLSALFKRLKSNRTHMAIVVDEDETAVGVVTMEDVLESIFGDIVDERDLTK